MDARIFGHPNQDNNDSNDRLPGYRRTAFLGPDYATSDVRLSRRLNIGTRFKVELLAECFNLLNRDNQRVTISDDGFLNAAGQFVSCSKSNGFNYFPGYHQKSANFLRASNAYAPRQMQLTLKLVF